MSVELELIRENVRRYSREVLAPAVSALNHYPDVELPAGLVSGLGELGVFELDESAALARVVEALAETSAAAATIVLGHASGRRLLETSRAECTGLCAYPIYAEPGLVDRGPRLLARGDRLELSGVSELVVNAPIASRLVLPVSFGEGVALIAIAKDAPGVTVGPPLLTLGLRGAPTADVRFERAELLPEGLLARDAAALIEQTLRTLRAPSVALCRALVASSLRTAIAYAQTRYQGGKNIIEHQEVRRLIATMTEADALCAEAVERLLSPDLPEPRALALFAQAKERASLATQDGVQLLGGYGYMEDFPQERCMRDARQAQNLLGRVELARQRVTTALTQEAQA
jgi:alkylation response protein AidB-like acyl-CoA dehydrogenase